MHNAGPDNRGLRHLLVIGIANVRFASVND